MFGESSGFGGWFDLRARVATFSLYIATDTAEGTSSSAHCSYATATTTVTTTTTMRVFARSLTVHLSNEGQFFCIDGDCQARMDTSGKGTQAVTITFGGNGLTGTIPPDMSEMTALTQL
jgi:hypothetical protein